MNSEINSNLVKLYVKDFSASENEESIAKFFGNYINNITEIEIDLKNPGNLQHMKPGAFVTFNNKVVAEEAMKALNLKKLNNKSIRIMRNEKDNTLRYNSHNNLFVKNIPESVDAREFYEYFLKFGDISSARLNENESGKHYGYGYVDYCNQDDAQKAIDNSDGKQIWEGKVLEVKNFIHKKERPSVGTETKTIYVKNFPNEYDENNLRDMFENFGKITEIKVLISNKNGKKFSIIVFDNEISAQIAIEKMNKIDNQGMELYCGYFEKKPEKSNQYPNNEISKYCNLHIKNIPCVVKEKELYENFSCYGTIKSLKISKEVKVETTENGIIKREISKEFGYICYENSESAQKAIQFKHRGYLKNWEHWKRPLIINYFQSRAERQKQNFQFAQPPQIPFENQFQNPQLFNNQNPYLFQYPTPIPSYPYMMNNNPMISGQFGFNYQTDTLSNSMMNMNLFNNDPNYSNTKNPYVVNRTKENHPIQSKSGSFNKYEPFSNKQQELETSIIEKDQINIEYFNNLEDDESKLEYLGEHVYKKVEDYLNKVKINYDIHTAGKITGMILGIQDKSEILNTIQDQKLIESRIKEALDLLNSN
jgi:RNA recognition motif-containing protein